MKQKLFGLAIIVFSIAVLLFASTGVLPQDTDCGPVIWFLALGIWCVRTKEDIWG